MALSAKRHLRRHHDPPLLPVTLKASDDPTLKPSEPVGPVGATANESSPSLVPTLPADSSPAREPSPATYDDTVGHWTVDDIVHGLMQEYDQL